MKTTLIAAIFVLAGLVLIPSVAPGAPAEPKVPEFSNLTRQLMFSAAYVKETSDRMWQVRLVGDLPRGPGLYVLIYNEDADLVKAAAIPWGTHTEKKPFIVTIPADGKAQQYVIKILGQQDNFNGIRLPLTNLPYEVYGDNYYAFGAGTGGNVRIVAFQANADNKPIHFSGWGAHYRILDADCNPIFDSKDHILPKDDPRRVGDMRNYESIATLEPGKTYWLDPYGVMYLQTRNTNLFVTFQPKRWFEPNLTWTLQSRPWWKGTVNVD